MSRSFSLVFLATASVLLQASAFVTPSPNTRAATRPYRLHMSSPTETTVQDPFDTYQINNPSQPLVFKDTIVGSGPVLQEDDLVKIDFTGKIMATGKQFAEGTIPLCYGEPGRVMKGWTMGLKGMRMGGTRTLKIPSRFAYGNRAFDEAGIPANADLEYQVTLVEKMDGGLDKFLYKTGLGMNVRTAGMLFFIGVMAVVPVLTKSGVLR